MTASGGDAAHVVTEGMLTMRENPGLALASIAVRQGAERPRPMGLVLPGPGCWVAGEGLSALWTGPGQWMLMAEGRADQDFASSVSAIVHGCSVTDQTDAWAAFDIASNLGEDPILALLARLVNVDTSRFPPGSATRTWLHHMGVVVIRPAADRVTVLGSRSAARSLWHVLNAAMRRQAAMAR
jgi:sarcosine oxidase subunit gamma